MEQAILLTIVASIMIDLQMFVFVLSNTADTFRVITAVHLVCLNGVILLRVTGSLAMNSSDEDSSVKEELIFEWDNTATKSCSHSSSSAVTHLILYYLHKFFFNKIIICIQMTNYLKFERNYIDV